jgi:hypothetical protein
MELFKTSVAWRDDYHEYRLKSTTKQRVAVPQYPGHIGREGSGDNTDAV